MLMMPVKRHAYLKHHIKLSQRNQKFCLNCKQQQSRAILLRNSYKLTYLIKPTIKHINSLMIQACVCVVVGETMMSQTVLIHGKQCLRCLLDKTVVMLQ
jgi:hypothetical protein